MKPDPLTTAKHPRNDRRDKDIFALREGGMTYRALGEQYGISTERARQLYYREKDRRDSK